MLAVLNGQSAFAGESDESVEYSRLLSSSIDNHGYTSFSTIPDSFKASIQLQTRYNYNQRGSDSTTLGGDQNDLSIGFTNRRSKMSLESKVTDAISAKVQFAFSQSSGAGSLEVAAMTWKLSDTVGIRAGQFKTALLREENISSRRQLTVDRSATNETFNQDYSQGIQLTVKEDSWRLFLSFTDGFGSDNTYFSSTAEADYAVTARFERRFGEASWSQYKQFTSWRGANGGLMVGAAFHFQEMGLTNPATTPATDMSTGTVDASLMGDGWNLFAAWTWRTMDTGVQTLSDAGFVFQGGVFVSDQDEFFARWDMIMPSNENATVVGVSGSEDFNTFTLGWNHYLIPESHAAKFTLQVQAYPDATTESIVAIKGNLLPDSTGDQFAFTAQFQLLF